MGGMTIRIVSIEPPWFEEKAQVQSCTWRELNQGHIPQEIVDAITPEFALKLTRSTPGRIGRFGEQPRDWFC